MSPHCQRPPTGPYACLVRLIIFDGGQRDGQIDRCNADPDELLVFDGPETFGVYRRQEPARTIRTREGAAEVWTSLS